MKKILVIDFGSQYTQLIARRLRELCVYSEVCPWDELPKLDEVEGFILSGGPESSNIEGNPTIHEDIFNTKKPILGICYGMQVLSFQEGGKVINEGKKEFGHAELNVMSVSNIFKNIDTTIDVWMSHGDKVDSLPQGYEITASSSNSPIAAFQNQEKKYYGLQFHPEVTHTKYGIEIIKNFVDVCGVEQNWDASDILKQIDELVRNEVKDDNVLLALSGGVDSTVLAAVLYKILGDKLTCVMVDHGLLRKNEAKNVVQNLKEKIGLTVNLVNAEDTFLSKLSGVTEPETKRKIIGNQFIYSFDRISNELGDIKYLSQGTLYPDIIESGVSKGKSAHVIKSHHNVGGLPDDMNFQLIEPLKELFKDEVREIGRELGLLNSLIDRHPFPGPGLAVRIIGEITKDRINILQEADQVYIDILHEDGLYNDIWQAFAVLIPVSTVGVMGDQRTYENLLGIRAVTSTDGMTADWFRMPPETLTKISNNIVNNVNGINRVVYDITSKPPGTIEWE